MTVGVLVDYLKTQSKKGVSHVYLSQEARDAVRSAIKAQKKVAPQPAPPTGAPAPLITARPVTAASAPPARTPVAKPTPQTVVAPDSVNLSLPAGEPAAQLAALKKLAHTWPPAQSLGTLKSRLVFSAGAAKAEIMIIGDAPGFDEETTQIPFTGKAGQKLDQILRAMTLNRNDLYLTNLCKFRPHSPRQTTDIRKPSAQEIAACMPLLKKEIEIVKPKCIIALGATTAKALLPNATESIADLRGTWQEFEGVALLPTFHPTYLLRNTNNASAKRKLWLDMIAVMERMEIPISQKQRNFFT